MKLHLQGDEDATCQLYKDTPSAPHSNLYALDETPFTPKKCFTLVQGSR
jgi:hypothetical protein